MLKIDKFAIDRRLYQIGQDRKWLAANIKTKTEKEMTYQRLSDIINNRSNTTFSTVDMIAEVLQVESTLIVMDGNN